MYLPLVILMLMAVVLARASLKAVVSMVRVTCPGAAAVRSGLQTAAFNNAGI